VYDETGGFIGFLIIALVHQGILIYAQWIFNLRPALGPLLLQGISSSSNSTGSAFGLRSLRQRICCALGGVACVLAAAFFFIFHKKCAFPYIYSGFAISEWLTVVFNVAFHATYILDVGERRVTVGSEGVDKL
jgi:hypothetical protein